MIFSDNRLLSIHDLLYPQLGCSFLTCQAHAALRWIFPHFLRKLILSYKAQEFASERPKVKICLAFPLDHVLEEPRVDDVQADALEVSANLNVWTFTKKRSFDFNRKFIWVRLENESLQILGLILINIKSALTLWQIAISKNLIRIILKSELLPLHKVQLTHNRCQGSTVGVVLAHDLLKISHRWQSAALHNDRILLIKVQVVQGKLRLLLFVERFKFILRPGCTGVLVEVQL